jgi:Protein of unknown function (DUF2817)
MRGDYRLPYWLGSTGGRRVDKSTGGRSQQLADARHVRVFRTQREKPEGARSGRGIRRLVRLGGGIGRLVELYYTFSRQDLQIAGVFLEFGTVPRLTVLDALIDENWVHNHPSTDRSGALGERLLQVFTPDDAEWRKAVWNKALATTKFAIHGLTGL